MTAPTPTPTPSLRNRVVATVLGVFAVLLVLVVVLVDLALGAQLRRDLDSRLVDRASRARQLAADGAVPPLLVAELQGQDIRVRLVTPSGDSYGDPGLGPVGPSAPSTDLAAPGPPGPPLAGPRPAPPRPDPASRSVTQTLPDGSRLLLVADSTAIGDVQQQLRLVMAVAAVVALAVAAAALAAGVGAALRPLDRMTALARRITAGDRGTRLRPDRPRTDLGRAAGAFDDALDALEDAETRARRATDRTRRFLADAAHELRTPLAGIQALAETIATRTTASDDPGALREQQRASLLLRETRQAARLVSDMLDLARIDEGVALHLADVDLAELVAAEAERTRALAPGLAVTVTAPPAAPVRADAQRITQILANLLDNARRHTPAHGRIALALEQDGETAAVTVANTGTPIPDAERERIFDRLVRLHDARDRDSGGAGLGLSIARGLARAHHGDLTCPPDPHGATFRLTLPARPVPEPEAPSTA